MQKNPIPQYIKSPRYCGAIVFRAHFHQPKNLTRKLKLLESRRRPRGSCTTEFIARRNKRNFNKTVRLLSSDVLCALHPSPTSLHSPDIKGERCVIIIWLRRTRSNFWPSVKSSRDSSSLPRPSREHYENSATSRALTEGREGGGRGGRQVSRDRERRTLLRGITFRNFHLRSRDARNVENTRRFFALIFPYPLCSMLIINVARQNRGNLFLELRCGESSSRASPN